MAAEKAVPESDPHDPELLDDLTERVFKDYQPPKEKYPSEQEEADEEADLAA